MENKDALALNHIRDLHTELMVKIIPDVKGFVLGFYTPEPDVLAYAAHHKEVAHLSHLCQAIAKRGGKYHITEELIEMFNTMPKFGNTPEERLQAAIKRFYGMQRETAFTMDAWSTMLTAWPLLHNLLKAYTKQIEDNTTLDFN